MEELEARLRDHLRTVLGAPRLEFAEQPTRVTGGFDTQIFAFRLAEAPPAYAGPLILRLLDAHHDPARALSEQATQNALADLAHQRGIVRGQPVLGPQRENGGQLGAERKA